MIDWIVEPAATGLALAGLIAALWGLNQLFSDVRINRKVNRVVPRVRHRKHDPLGDDYRKHVAAYAAKVERRRAIVRRTAGV